MPADESLQWIEFTDFSPGIFSNNNLAGGVQVTSDNPCKAQETNTFRCIALPTGGLGPLPRLQASATLTTVPDTGNGYTYNVAGFSTWGRVLASPATDSSDTQTELHVVVYYDYPDGGGFYNAELIWLREDLFNEVTPATEIIRQESQVAVGNSGPRYAYLLKTRMNPADTANVGYPVMVCVATRVASNDIIISRAWPDPANPDSLDSIVVGAVAEDDPYIIATAHQGRIIFGRWGAYDHGPDASLVTNENMLWTDYNSNLLVTTTPAQFVPELDQSIIDMCPMSANQLIVVKWYGGGYVLQGDLDDVTVVQLPNLPCPDGADYVRGVNTSRGFIYSAGLAGMYVWNGGDGATCISTQLDGSFAVGSNFITGANGQCDRWMDRVLVPQNWVWDTLKESWWRIEDIDTINIRFWSTVAFRAYAYGGEASFTDEAPNFIHRFRYDDLAYSFSWQSHPLWISRDFYMDARQGVVALQGHGVVQIVLSDEDGNTVDEEIAVDSDVIRNYRFDLGMIAQNLTVRIVSSGDVGAGPGTSEAPLIHRLYIAYKPANHLANTNN